MPSNPLLTGAPDSWVEIELPNKPSSVHHHPVFIWPGHLPRLDWMLWFVPLRMARGGRMPDWCERFIFLLLCGADLRASKDLLADNPFAGSRGSGAPKYVRISLYDYHLSNCRFWRTRRCQTCSAPQAQRRCLLPDGPAEQALFISRRLTNRMGGILMPAA